MKRVCPSLALAALGLLLATSPASSQSCSIGGHNETSENFGPASGWAITPFTPGSVPSAFSGTHLVISEVGPRGCGTGAGSDSSEFIEIYNPTSRPVSLDDKYISDETTYYRVVNGSYPSSQSSDWNLRFPSGLTLLPGNTLVLCVTKAGFAGSGASPGGAQIFLEMANSNGNTSDDMINVVTGSSFPISGGNLTNPSGTGGEWVVLYCWNGTSDLVCDIDYASWGAHPTTPANAKMDKTGVTIDGPDAGTATSAYNSDTNGSVQLNLGSGSVLAKPNTYQRTANEMGEVETGGNGCVGRIVPTVIDWLPVAGAGGEPKVRFHIRWTNQDEDASSSPVNGLVNSQHFGVFQPDFGPIGAFNVPPLQPASFFDVFFEVPLSALPPAPEKGGGAGGGVPALATSSKYRGPTLDVACPPDTNWAGNVDVQWTGSGQGGTVNKHYADLLTCPGGDPSLIHVRPSNCPTPMPWSLIGVCPGYTVTLVNEDFTPAPNPLPVGWSGWIKVTAAAGVPSGTNCCFGIVFTCDGETSTIDICSTACDCATAVGPVLTAFDWTTVGTTVTFHGHWENPSTTSPTAPVSGSMSSQELGVFLPNFGPIGDFDVPSIPVGHFFDVFVDIDVSQLPPEPPIELPGGTPPAGSPCAPTDHWHGNVDLVWAGAGGTGQANYHFGEMPVISGGGPTYLFVETGCNSPVGATWSISGLCPGFTATLVNPDHSPAPNPVPNGWIGLIQVTAAAGVPSGTTCCFNVDFVCDGVPGTIKVCAKACNPKRPVLKKTDWAKNGSNVRFHMQWQNPDGTGPSDPVSGEMNAQPFGVFLPNSGPIGQFNVPPIAPNSFFDVFLEVPLTSLPPEPEERLPGGGPAPGSPCPEDTSWSGNVDIMWNGPGGQGQTNYHFTGLLVKPGSGSSHVHTLIFCNAPAGATWSIAGLCPGFSASLLNENFTPAPNPVPPGWTGWISVAAAGSVPAGTSCCFTVAFTCEGETSVIDVCAETCVWENAGVPPNTAGVDFGIYATNPNPARNGMTIGFAMPQSGAAQLDVYNLAGQRVRRLLEGTAEAGLNSARWDGRGEHGRALPPGAYFVRLKALDRVSSKKVVLFH